MAKQDESYIRQHRQGYAVIEEQKLPPWKVVRFVADRLTREQAKGMCTAHNRWWRLTHYDIVPPVVMQRLEDNWLRNARMRTVGSIGFEPSDWAELGPREIDRPDLD